MKRTARNWLLAGAASLLLLLVAASVVFTRFIDTPAARAEIQRLLDAALGGHITWQSLEVRLLLVPHGELKQVRVDLPGRLTAEAERVQVYLRLWPLLRGRPEIASVTLDGPRIRILPGEASDAPVDAMAAYRAVAEPLARALQEFATDTTLRLNGAELSGPVALRAVNATARSGAAGIDLELDAGADLWKALHVEARLDYADLSAKARARLDDLDLAAVGALAGLESIGRLEGRASANAELVVDKSWRAEAHIARSTATFRMPDLPGAVALSAGTARIDERGIGIEKAALAMLDAKALVSGTIAARQLRVDLAITEGVAGEQLLGWALDKAGAPAALELKAPVRVVARHVTWDRAAGLGIDATLDSGGPQVGVVLGWKPPRLELRQLAIKDAQSDATFSAVLEGERLEAGFAGVLHAQSLAALRRQPEQRSGRMQGDLRLTLDRERPLRSKAQGSLAIDALDLSVLAGRPVRIERAELAAQGDDLRIAAARVVVDEQTLDLSGEVRRTRQGPVVDAKLESPGVVLERLLPPAKPAAGESPSKLWPLPVTGKVAVRAGFLQAGQHRVAPLEGTIALEPERARLDVQAARVCGVSFPLQMDATPTGYIVAARLAMKDEPFETAIKCLTGDSVQITGSADLRADLRTQGKTREELLRGLAGNAEAELRKGSVHRFALIGNILSVQNLTSVRDPRELDRGFLYRSMTAKGRFEGGNFVVDEGFFDSDAARIAVNGKVDLLGARSQLNVLVGLFSSVDRVTGAIPILGNVLGGTLIALPVSVSGDIRDPLVVPLGPRAVSDRLLGVFERTLKLPGKLVPAEREEKR